MKNLWHYRQLLYFLIVRDIKVRYKQTTIGIAWALLKPIITMVVFTFLFGTLTQSSVGAIPYSIFVFFGLLLWNVFYQSVINCSESIVSNQSLITKVYFPRIILPLSAVMVALIDFFIASLIFIILLLFFHFTLDIRSIVLIPVGVISITTLGLGVGILLAALNVRFRDIRFLVPFALQLLLFVTPIIYPMSFVSARLQILMLINPLALIINTIRETTLQGNPLNFIHLITGMLLSGLTLIGGIMFFQRKEHEFVDLI